MRYPLLLLLIVSFAIAEDLKVEKTVDTPLTTDKDVIVRLAITNPYDKDITVQIVDENILGNNGLRIQCLEADLVKGKTTVLEYDPIRPYTPGNFTLSKATVKYTSPEGKELVAESAPVKIEVTGPSKGAQGGITEIYQCGNMNMRSTSYSSSGGNFQFSFNQGQNNQGEDDLEERLQDSMMNQDSNALKRSMQKEQAREDEMRGNLSKMIESDKDFSDLQKGLEEKGYTQTSKDIQPKSPDTGDFSYNYKNTKGDTAQISGNVDQGKVNSKSFSTEDIAKELGNIPEYKKAAEDLKGRGFSSTPPVFDSKQSKLFQDFRKDNGDTARISADWDFGNKTLENFTVEKKDTDLEKKMMNESDDFKELDSSLKEEGFVPEKADFTQEVSQDFTQFSKDYLNNKTGEKRNLTGKLKDDKVIEIRYDEERRAFWPYLLIIAALGAYLFLGKKKAVMTIEAPFDYLAESRRILERSKAEFGEKNFKEAYSLASLALRTYYTNRFSDGRERTSTDTIELLKRNRHPHKNAQSCLNLCNMVEFAKYEPNKADFDKIMEMAEREIV